MHDLTLAWAPPNPLVFLSLPLTGETDACSSIGKEAVMGNQDLVMSNVYHVKEVCQLIIDDDQSLKSFTSFFAADDFCCECEYNGLNVYIESRTAVGPVLTDQDLDSYVEFGPGLGIDPRGGFDEGDLPEVMMFLAYAAELKSIDFDKKAMYAEAHVYETLLYAYHRMADSFYSIC